MLTLLTTDEFADWYAALDDAGAEEVATGLELLRELGPERAPPHSRDLLLWYQADPDAQRWHWLDGGYIDFAQRVRAGVAQIESERVQSRLSAALPEAQRRASAALAAIRTLAHPRSVLRALKREGAEAVFAAVQHHFHTVLDVANVPPIQKPAYSDTLNELNFPTCRPGLRVLYGVDVPNERALLVLGESLDQRAYGPSVRRALRVWREFLSSDKSEQPVLQERPRP